MEDPRYPIGRFQAEPTLTDVRRRELIEQIAAAPARLREAIAGLTEQQLDTPYRDGGWTVRQVAHHVPDSHLNAYIRFKLGLTEDSPPIKTYDQTEWAKTAEMGAPPDFSLDLLDALHRRWVHLLRSLGPNHFARTIEHPEWGKITLDFLVQLYAWHGRHHVAHITSLRQRMGWR